MPFYETHVMCFSGMISHVKLKWGGCKLEFGFAPAIPVVNLLFTAKILTVYPA